jgi:predicted dehydrogenase
MWLILGGGAVVREYYLPAFQYLGLLDEILIIEPSIDNSIKIELLFENIKIKSITFQKYFKDENIDSSINKCIIALPNHLHKEAIGYCISNGINFLCEKPLSLIPKDVQQISLESNAKNIISGIAMVRRFMPSYLALKKAFKSNIVGELISVEISDGAPFTWVADSAAFFDRRNGGVLADMGIHYLDLLFDLFGSEIIPFKYTHDSEGGVEANCKIDLRYKEKYKIGGQESGRRIMVIKRNFLISAAVFYL